VNPHHSAYTIEQTLLRRESEVQRTVNASESRFWRIQSPKAQLAWTSYGLPGESSPPFASPEAAFLKRAAFLKTNLWVTKYHPNERYPAGDYPNQNPGGDGLPL